MDYELGQKLDRIIIELIKLNQLLTEEDITEDEHDARQTKP